MARKIFFIIGIVALAGATVYFLKSGKVKEAGESPTGATALNEPDGSKGTLGVKAPATGESGTSGEGAPSARQDKAAAGAGGGGPPTLTTEQKAEDIAYLSAAPMNEKEIKSMKTLLGTFLKFDRGRKDLNGFIGALEKAGMNPHMAKDENPYTGKMLVVRTKEALEGTRYLHAQYFEDGDKNKEPFRQHISFEMRPSPDCMEKAKAYLEASLGKKLPKPEKPPTDSWVEWHVDGYSFWIHRLGRADIPDHPFNARTMADIGACHVAKEMIPDEGHEE